VPTKPIKVWTVERREFARTKNELDRKNPTQVRYSRIAELIEYGDNKSTLTSRCSGFVMDTEDVYFILIDRESPEAVGIILTHELRHIKNDYKHMNEIDEEKLFLNVMNKGLKSCGRN
jgi:hypothetical protein